MFPLVIIAHPDRLNDENQEICRLYFLHDA
jgi:hypothetical protein